METYQLINPFIIGNIKTSAKADTPIEGAKQIWGYLSDNIVKYVPKFLFTIKNMSGGNIYHFAASETSNGKDLIDFEITEIEGNMDEKKLLKRIKQHLQKFKQSGGKHHHDKDDSSSSSSDEDKELIKAFKKHKRSFGVGYVDYFPPVYVGNSSFFVPSFGISANVVVDPPFVNVYYGTDIVPALRLSEAEKAIHEIIGLSPSRWAALVNLSHAIGL